MNLDVIKSVVLGSAIGDALGVPVEFASREELKEKPITDMEGFGTYPYPAGSWSDDTSMSLAALDSLANDKVDLDEIMYNFGKWYYEDEYTPIGEMFDVGNTCSFAIHNYFKGKCDVHNCGIDEEEANGNGSLMRIYPICLYVLSKGLSDVEAINYIHNVSALTHAHMRSKIACGIYYFILKEIINRPHPSSIVLGLSNARIFYQDKSELRAYRRRLFEIIGKAYIKNKHWDNFTEDAIRSTGYVVDTLEAVIWCLRTTDNYKDCVLKAVNLGDDTDTIAAIAGGLAGALYGYNAIPKEWLNALLKREYIEEMCERAFNNWK